MTAILPTISIYKFIADPNLSLFEIAPGRLHLPHYVLYIIGWSIFIPYFLNVIAPGIKLIFSEMILKVGDRELIIDNIVIHHGDIFRVNYDMFSRMIVQLSGGDIVKIHIAFFSEDDRNLIKDLINRFQND